MNEARPHKLQIYTDGSCIKINQGDGLTGLGYAFIQFDYEHLDYRPSHIASAYLGHMATVFQAEMCAILAAAQTTISNELLYKQQGITEIDIISDSLSSLQALTKQVTTSQLIKDTKDTLNTLSEMFKVNLHWIKAHQGHAGNELADQTAKGATQYPTYGVEAIIPVSRSWIQKKIKYFLHKEWSAQWSRLPEARQTKLFFPTPHSKHQRIC
jgi:ribonuclease HI